MKRYQGIVALAAAIVVQIMLGGIYAWSSLVPSLVSDLKLTPLQTQILFGSTIAVFTLTMLGADRILRSFGPRRMTAVAGLLFAAGYGIAVLGRGSFMSLLVGISGISGVAIGLGYICPLRIGTAWFPRRKGLVTGMVTAGFGIGGIVLAYGIERSLSAGISILPLLGWMGLLYGSIIFGAAILFVMPSHPTKTASTVPLETGMVSKSGELRSFLRSRNFRTWSGAMYCGTFAGLLIIGALGPIVLERGGSATSAAMAVSTFAIGNGLGRISWGTLFDRWQGKVLPWSFVVILLAAFPMALPTVPTALLPFLAALLGFGFGGCFVLFAALTADHYGADRLALLYPWIFVFYGAAGIAGPAMGGLLLQTSGSYQAGILLAAVTAAVGGVLVSLPTRSHAKAFLPHGAHYAKDKLQDS